MKLSSYFATLALVVAGSTMAQEYLPPSDPRSPQYNEYQRQQQEQAEKTNADKQRQEEASAQSAENMRTFMDNQHKLQEQLSGQVEQDRAMFLKTPALPAQRNGLLGQWKLDTTKTSPANALAELNAMFSQPACEMVFGDGIWDFRGKALYSNDEGIGEQMLTEVDYRGNEGIVGVVPKTFMRLLIFKIIGPNRVQELTSTRIGADPCTFVRVGGSTQASGAPTPSGRAVNATASHGPAAASAPPAPSETPTHSTLSRPSPEACRQTLLDKLGVVGVNQVRAMSDVRFKEAAIEGKEPNTSNLRIDLRGSACDDPRIKATLYDFDGEGMLQSITYVWDRPAGPAPAAIFQERVKTLSLHHNLPPPQSPGRLQADTSIGRLILQDMPERNLLLEAYAAKK